MEIIERSVGMILRPKVEWAIIAAEEPKTKQILTQFFLRWLIFDGVCSFLGDLIFGTKSIGWAFAVAITTPISYAILLLAVTALINELAVNFSSQQNFGRATQLVCYSLSPFFMCQLFSIVPQMQWLASLSFLASIYLIFIGLPYTMKTPPLKVLKYMIMSWVGMVLAMLFVNILIRR